MGEPLERPGTIQWPLAFAAVAGISLVSCTQSQSLDTLSVQGNMSDRGPSEHLGGSVAKPGADEFVLTTPPSCRFALLPQAPRSVALPFKPESSPSQAVDFALPTWLSILAYKPHEQIVSDLLTQGFGTENILSIEETLGNTELLPGTLQGFVAQGAKGRFVVFRGTSDPLDWIVNLDFALDMRAHALADGAAAHRGFYSAAIEAARVTESLRSYEGPGSELPVWVIGHSQGGAYASLFGLLAARAGLPLGAVVTINQPRVANATLAQLIDEQIGDRLFRLVNSKDIIPHFPPTAVAAETAASALIRVNGELADHVRNQLRAAGFVHAGIENVLDGGQLYRSNEQLTDRKDEDSFKALLGVNHYALKGVAQPLRKILEIAEKVQNHRPELFFCALTKDHS
jgi:pimeloyl-ACP methyl ester carboxylesterase